MGVLYSVAPLDNGLRDALPGMGVLRAPAANGRHPTPQELRSVLADLKGYKATFNDPAEVGDTWQASIEDAHDPESGPWTLLNVSEYKGEFEAAEMWFEKGWPDLIVTILVAVTAYTGPLVLLADCGGVPLVIQQGDDPEQLYRSWQMDAEDE